ncbi:Aste57867_22771 [Aphanomyces stellatus]|uniref:Aste57867_22771 protein n=1 Tax=Aphanomyces stellatus TaxID=120398 RepID=A0A485LMJ9_9STRA|nr:hypothetical protein As57867_022701 [Aphanomyces stellatus]VFT99424.1 Aste57867_22771 [Aphanomyces stellatus]
MVASEEGHLRVIEFLVSKGASVDQANDNGYTPLMVASEKGHLEIVRILADNDACLIFRNNVSKKPVANYGMLTYITPQDGITAKGIATKKGHLDIAEYLDEVNPSPRLK